MTLIYLNDLGYALDMVLCSLAVIGLAWEDWKHMGILPSHDLVYKLLIAGGWVILLLLWWQAAIIQAVLALLAYYALLPSFNKILADLDKEDFGLLMGAAFPFAWIGIATFIVTDIVRARRHKGFPLFPAMVYFALGWFLAIFAWLAWTVF